MDSSLTAALQQLDCTPKEIRLFQASYHLGPAALSAIATKAGLQRSTAYLIVEELIKKRLISHNHSDYAKTYTAASPRDLLQLLKTKQRTVSKIEHRLEDNLSELQLRYRANDILPKVIVHQGKKGLSVVQSEILQTKGEILLWTNQYTERSVFSGEQHQQFIQYRVKRQLPIRVLAVNNPEGQQIEGKNEALFREVRLLPTETSFNTETYIYDNSIAILDFNADIVCVIIRNSSIASSHRALFEMTWKGQA